MLLLSLCFDLATFCLCELKIFPVIAIISWNHLKTSHSRFLICCLVLDCMGTDEGSLFLNFSFDSWHLECKMNPGCFIIRILRFFYMLNCTSLLRFSKNLMCDVYVFDFCGLIFKSV